MRRLEVPFSLPEGDVLCAVSGGVDSMCLLELSRRRGGPDRRLAAAHFNHALRGRDADGDEAFVRRFCEEKGIPFFAGRGDAAAFARKEGLSLEAAGRQLRYAFLEEIRLREGYAHILTAHHADDNAETVLFHLIRGTGLRGLCGIPPLRGAVARPLLHLRRRELLDLAAAWEIPYVEDQTNQDPAAAVRNRLRLEIIPQLEALVPGAAAHMAAAAARLRADEETLSAQAETLIREAELIPGVSAAVDRRLLQSAPAALAARAVQRLAAAVCGGEREVSALQIQALLQLRRGQLSLPGGAVALAEGETLRILRPRPAPAPQTLALGMPAAFGPWQVTMTDTPQAGALALSCPVGAELRITVPQPGDRLGGRSVKRLCADRGIPPVRRDTLPLLRIEEYPAAAANLGIDEAFAPGRHPAARWIKFDEIQGAQKQ